MNGILDSESPGIPHHPLFLAIKLYTNPWVSFVQYSDEAKSEFKLNTFDDKAQALGALQNIQYRGGNTRTGKALTFIKEKVLTWESGMRRGVPKVLVVVTDGRSQDEVRKAATVIQHSD
ncbi:hypothetical protein llap_21048 [Limosa lapponica baueri]|uniref:VWFA domain-containing protein n=1 Tax=Limosa lapponica baueri TaxID=1758121 RepID=A0A2I0T4E4_LIMLA|nr:hypothetical protein llap_21048 [Limosa lapponica baueri]